MLLPLQQGASFTAHYTQGVASLALGYELLPLWGVPAKTRPHRKVLRMRKNLCRSVRSVGVFSHLLFQAH